MPHPWCPFPLGVNLPRAVHNLAVRVPSRMKERIILPLRYPHSVRHRMAIRDGWRWTQQNVEWKEIESCPRSELLFDSHDVWLGIMYSGFLLPRRKTLCSVDDLRFPQWSVLEHFSLHGFLHLRNPQKKKTRKPGNFATHVQIKLSQNDKLRKLTSKTPCGNLLKSFLPVTLNSLDSGWFLDFWVSGNLETDRNQRKPGDYFAILLSLMQGLFSTNLL